jgi:hypothetical protein
MMSVTIRMSRRNPGIGVIRAITMPRTASGTPSSFQLVRVVGDFHDAGGVIVFAWARAY